MSDRRKRREGRETAAMLISESRRRWRLELDWWAPVYTHTSLTDWRQAGRRRSAQLLCGYDCRPDPPHTSLYLHAAAGGVVCSCEQVAQSFTDGPCSVAWPVIEWVRAAAAAAAAAAADVLLVICSASNKQRQPSDINRCCTRTS